MEDWAQGAQQNLRKCCFRKDYQIHRENDATVKLSLQIPRGCFRLKRATSIEAPACEASSYPASTSLRGASSQISAEQMESCRQKGRGTESDER